jgi:trimethylamine:corrinoid methyltransferase-like protein
MLFGHGSRTRAHVAWYGQGSSAPNLKSGTPVGGDGPAAGSAQQALLCVRPAHFLPLPAPPPSISSAG